MAGKVGAKPCDKIKDEAQGENKPRRQKTRTKRRGMLKGTFSPLRPERAKRALGQKAVGRAQSDRQGQCNRGFVIVSRQTADKDGVDALALPMAFVQ